MTAVDLRFLDASGPLEGFGLLTALTGLQLAENRFTGALRWHVGQAAACTRGVLRGSLVRALEEYTKRGERELNA